MYKVSLKDDSLSFGIFLHQPYLISSGPVYGLNYSDVEGRFWTSPIRSGVHCLLQGTTLGPLSASIPLIVCMNNSVCGSTDSEVGKIYFGW